MRPHERRPLPLETAPVPAPETCCSLCHLSRTLFADPAAEICRCPGRNREPILDLTIFRMNLTF